MRSICQRYFLGAIALVAGSWLVGCQQTGEALADRKQRENEAEIQQYITANGLQATQLPGTGAYYVKSTTVPNSQSAAVGDEVRFFVTSRRFDGTVIDSTDGIHPASYTYGTNPSRSSTLAYGSYLYNNITNGMFLGLTVAKEGERVTMLVPSSLDAGRQGSLTLPQYSPIRYDIRVVSVRTEDEQIDDYVAANKINVTQKLDNGIRVAKTLARPDSALIQVGQTPVVQYTAKLLNGTVFKNNVPTAAAIVSDPSSATAGESITIGQTNVEAGLTEGLKQVRRGEKAILIFPSSLGYGTTGIQGQTVSVPPFAPLVYEVNILRVN